MSLIAAGRTGPYDRRGSVVPRRQAGRRRRPVEARTGRRTASPPRSTWPPQDDGSFTAGQAGLLDSALTDAGVDHTLEFCPARHGFAVPDNLSYDTEADARHWEALHQLYRAHLHRS